MIANMRSCVQARPCLAMPALLLALPVIIALGLAALALQVSKSHLCTHLFQMLKYRDQSMNESSTHLHLL